MQTLPMYCILFSSPASLKRSFWINPVDGNVRICFVSSGQVHIQFRTAGRQKEVAGKRVVPTFHSGVFLPQTSHSMYCSFDLKKTCGIPDELGGGKQAWRRTAFEEEGSAGRNE